MRRRKIDAQLVFDARRKCTGASVHGVEQILLCLPMLYKVHNSRKCKDRAVVAAKIDDLERVLYALAHR
jgi:hypothetical protein